MFFYSINTSQLQSAQRAPSIVLEMRADALDVEAVAAARSPPPGAGSSGDADGAFAVRGVASTLERACQHDIGVESEVDKLFQTFV